MFKNSELLDEMWDVIKEYVDNYEDLAQQLVGVLEDNGVKLSKDTNLYQDAYPEVEEDDDTIKEYETDYYNESDEDE